MMPETHLRAALSMLGEEGQEIECTLEGDCMAPLLREGDRMVIRPGLEGLRRGDVVVFWWDGRLRVNRVMAVNGRGAETELTACSDNTFPQPRLVRSANLVGKVMAVGRADRKLDLECWFWRLAARCLWCRAQVNVRRRRRATVLWRCMDFVVRCREALPVRGSLVLLPLRVALKVAGRKRADTAPKKGGPDA